ncbi:MAG TPA: type II secretion system F family protein [Usitatibacter sp.]|nr:type II secretion system F family protein [Usitatibacter sp.]
MKPLPYATRAEIFLQLYRLELAGLPYDKAIATLAVPASASPRLKAMQALAARGVDAAKAGEQSGLFTRLESRLVRAALIAGTPAPTYQRLADYYSHRARQLAVIKSRLAMPAFVLAIALVIQPLPALVGGAIGLMAYLWEVAWPVLLIAGIAVALRLAVMSFPRLVPLYGPIHVRANLRDFFESLALMIEAGVPLLEAMPAALDAVDDAAIRSELARLPRLVEKQGSFAAALESVSSLRASRVLAFAHTGEQSGKLPEMLMRHAAMESADIAAFYVQLAAWLPRVVYALVAIKIIAGIFSSGGVGPRVPRDL